MNLKLITPPSSEPVTLAEAKLHLRVDLADDDDQIEGLIVAAREKVETDVRRSLLTTTWELTLDGFPCVDFDRPDRAAIVLPRPPLASVTSIKYLDQAGDEQTLDPSAYRVLGAGGRGPGRIVPARGNEWPVADDQAESVTVRFVAGGSSAKESTKAAIKLLVGQWYENREATVAERASFVLPLGVSALLDPERWGGYR